MRIAVMILSLLLVTACVAEKKKLGEGAVTVAPLGHIDLCARESEHKLCKKQ